MVVYIYVLKDPIINEIRYVGKTKNLKNRLNCHLYRKNDTNKVNWIKKLKKINKKPIIEIVKECNDKNWKKWEKFYIKKYLLEGCKLLNYTGGGDGLTFANKTSFKGENAKKIVLLTKDGKYLNTFDSMIMAEKYIGKRGIDSVLSGKTKTCGGFICLYESIYEKLNKEEIQNIIIKSNINNGKNNGKTTQFKTGNIPWNVGKKWKRKKCKKVYQYNKLTKNFIKEWNSTIDASEILNIHPESIGGCCRNVKKSGGGFLWSYEKKDNF